MAVYDVGTYIQSTCLRYSTHMAPGIPRCGRKRYMASGATIEDITVADLARGKCLTKTRRDTLVGDSGGGAGRLSPAVGEDAVTRKV